MSFPYQFIGGFFTSLLLVAAMFYALHTHIRRKRFKIANVRGYLDLIPDLSPEQREKVQEIRRTFLPKVNRIREKLRRERAELAKLLFSVPKDRDRIHEVTNQILQHQSELEHEVIEHILEEQRLLTPAQNVRFYEIITEQFSSGGLGVHDVRAGD